METVYTDRYICSMNFKPRSEKTRQFIIESTADVFNKKGFAGTSLTDLTEATQLTKGSIYGNFENKEEVAIAVFEYNIARRGEMISEQVNRAVTYKDKLMAYATAFSKEAKTMCAKGGCPYLNTGIEADDTNENLRKHVADALLKWKQHIVSIINKGKEAGEFKEDTDASKTAVALIALIEGGIFMTKVIKSTTYIDIATDTAKSIVSSIAT